MKKKLLVAGVVCIATLLAVVIGLRIRLGSFDACLQVASGKLVFATPTTLLIGTGKEGEVREYDLTATNLRRRRITLVGAQSTCSCFATDDLPIVLEPGESKAIRVTVRFVPSEENGDIDRALSFITDDSDHRFLPFRIVGRVLEDAS